MQLSFHTNHKLSETSFTSMVKNITSFTNSIKTSKLGRVEIRKNELYNEAFTIVLFVIEKKCITSLIATCPTLAEAVDELQKEVYKYNAKQRELARIENMLIEVA